MKYVRILCFLFVFLLTMSVLNAQAKEWKTYKDCVFLSEEYYDGDSFHVKHGDKHVIIRLCFVDAPETDTSIQDRLMEQADYWNVSIKEVMDTGDKAKVFANKFMKNGFTVHTQGVDARGRSKRQRIFGMISVKDRYLCEALVENGLARVHGFKPILPGGVSGFAYEGLLQEIEKEAKANGKGIWKNVSASEIVLKKNTAVYTIGPFPSVDRILKPGTKLKIIGDYSAFMIKVGYESDGKTKEALCKRSDVGIWRSK